MSADREEILTKLEPHATKLGLEIHIPEGEQFVEVSDGKRGVHLGVITVHSSPDKGVMVQPHMGNISFHRAPKDALKLLADCRKKCFFAVELEFAKNLSQTDEDPALEIEEFLADVLYAYRRHLSIDGAKVKKIVVGGTKRVV